MPVSKRGVSCGTPATATGATTSTSAEKVGRGRPTGAKVVHRKLTGVPKAEVAGLSKEKVTETLGDRIAQVAAGPAGVSRN